MKQSDLYRQNAERDHIVSHTNEHGPSHRPYRALQRWRCLEIDFRQIFEVIRFSSFATVSALFGSERSR